MNRDKETTARIEARLERSLRRQVTAPKLDGRFDAAVWSRIAEEDRAAARAPQPDAPARDTGMPRWLVACNVLGIAVTVVLVLWFGVRQLGGVDLGQEIRFDWMHVTADQQKSLLAMAGNIVAVAAVLFGLMFTRLGRRLISSLR